MENLESIPTSVVLNYVDSVARRMGVDSRLAQSIVLAENMGSNGVIPTTISTTKVSPKQAYGISQITPDTYEGLKSQGYLPADHSLDSWQRQVEAGVAALKAKSKEHKTNDPVILAAAYNAGNNGAKLASEGNYDALPAETKDYLNKLRMADTYLAPNSPRDIHGQTFPGVPDPRTVRDSRFPSVGVQSVAVTDSVSSPNATKDRAILVMEQGMERNRDVLENLIKQVTGSTEDAAAELNSASHDLLRAATAEGTAAEITATMNAANAQIRERNLQISNLDTRRADNEFARLLSENVELQNRREPVRREIDARMSVGFFDNPLQWLVNQTILPGKVEEYNALARRENDNSAKLSDLQARVTAQNAIAAGPTADLYLQHGLALKDSAAAKATADAAKLRSQASGLIAQKVLSIASLRERIAADQERLERWKIILSDQRDKDQKKAEDLERERDLNRRLQLIGDTIGAEGLNLETLKRRSKKEQEEILKRADTLTLGDSFADAYEFVTKYGDLTNLRLKGAAEFSDMMRAMQTVIKRRGEEIRNTWAAQHPELATKPPSAALAERMAAEEYGRIWEGAKDNNLLIADNTNPYRANHQKMAVIWKGDENNPIYRMVREAQKNQQLVTDTQLIEATRNLVRTRALTPAQAAAAFSEYYSSVIDRNNTDRNLRSLGLQSQETYRVKSPGGPSPTLDLTNTVAVENHFTADYAKYLRSRAIGVTEEFIFLPPESLFGDMIKVPNPEARTRRDTERRENFRLEDVIRGDKVENKNKRPPTPPSTLGGARS